MPLRNFLPEHDVSTAYELEWSEQAGFEVLITTDQNPHYQQNLESREIAIVVFLSTSWPKIQEKTSSIVDSLDNLESETYLEIIILDVDNEG